MVCQPDKMIDLHGLLWQEVGLGEVGRAARSQGEGKASEDPHRGSQSNTLVLKQISFWAVNP